MKSILTPVLTFLILAFSSCDIINSEPGKNPDLAETAVIDRFSEAAGTLYIRSNTNMLPDAGEAIDFDAAPFLNKGLGPNGEYAEYYDFDVQPLSTAPLYVLRYKNTENEVPGQLNIIDVIPGDEGYSDFWHMNIVYVPRSYVPNSVSSYDEILERGFDIEATGKIVNCPVAPDGSTASLRYDKRASADLHRGWYKGKTVYYFTFEEKEIIVNIPEFGDPYTPLSGIMVCFNINPDEPGGGPPSGFVTEAGSSQTHNVLETLPEDELYSPLWSVSVYDNADFNQVSDWTSAQSSNILANNVMYVNCPVVLVN